MLEEVLLRSTSTTTTTTFTTVSKKAISTSKTNKNDKWQGRKNNKGST